MPIPLLLVVGLLIWPKMQTAAQNHTTIHDTSTQAETASPVSPIRSSTSSTFADVTSAVGMNYSGDTWGLGWGDSDGDGYLDLFGNSHFFTPTLYLNQGDGTFTEVLDSSGIDPVGDHHDSSWMDYNDDGDLDLYVTVGARGGNDDGPNLLYQNDGTAHFTDVAASATVTNALGRGRGAAWADYDRDGDPDLFVANAYRADAPNAFFRNNGDGTFEDVGAAVGLAKNIESQSAAWADYDGDGDPDLYTAGNQCRLYRNDGISFTDVTTGAGVSVTWGAGASWGDYDNDGKLDLYVSSGRGFSTMDYAAWSSSVITFVSHVRQGYEEGLDTATPPGTSLVFHLRQRRNKHITTDPSIIFLGPDGSHPPTNPFTATHETSGPPPYAPGEDMGFFIWQSAPGAWHMRWTVLTTTGATQFSGLITASGPISSVTKVGFEEFSWPSYPDHLFRNDGDGTFTDVSISVGVSCDLDSRGVTWGDYDNDGDLDLFLVLAGRVSYDVPDRLYRNNGDDTFTEVAALEGATGSSGGLGWSAAWADYDNDGFLDLLIGNRRKEWPLPTGGYQLLHNQGNINHWLKIQFAGGGMGAKVWVTAGGETQFRELRDESSHFAHYNGPLHVGLGANTVVDDLRIKWPNGVTLVWTNVPVDQLLVVPPPRVFFLPLVFEH
jgi:hypothetical protein